MNSSILMDLDPDVYKSIFLILLLVLVFRFIMLVIKKLLDYKLKNGIVEKGLTEEYALSILQQNKKSESLYAFKWFSVLFSTGIGLFVTSYFSFGVHSFGIVILSISIGFLFYFLYTKNYKE